MDVVLVSSDLMTVSRVANAAAAKGDVTVRVAANEARASELRGERRPDLVIIDLGLAGLEIGELVRQLKSDANSSVRIAAFGPHVHEDRLIAARAAGCDDVLSRGQFFAQVDAILNA